MTEQHDRTLPLTAAQEAIWLADQLGGDPGLYVIGQVTEVRGDVDPVRVADAVEWALARHPELRVRIEDGPDGPTQTVTDERPRVEIVDLRGEDDPDAASHARAHELVAAVPSPAQGMPVRAEVHRITDAHARLVVVAHHLVADGVGLALLGAESARRFRGGGSASETDLAAAVTADADYRGSEAAAADLEAWTERLATAPRGARLREGEVPVRAGGVAATLVVDSGVRSNLEAAAERAGVSPARLVVALCGAWLNSRLGADRLTYSLPTPARGHRALRAITGPVSTALPVTITSPGGASLDETVRDVDAALDTLARHGRQRGEALQGAMRERRPGWAGPRIGINVVPEPRAVRAEGVEFTSRPLAAGPVGDAELFVVLTAAHTIEIAVRADPSLTGRAAALLDGLDRFLAAYADDPAAPLADLVRQAGGLDPAGEPAPSGLPVDALAGLDAAVDAVEAGGPAVRVATLEADDQPVTPDRLRELLAAHHPALAATLVAPSPLFRMLTMPAPGVTPPEVTPPDASVGAGFRVAGSAEGALVLEADARVVDAESFRILVEDARRVLASGDAAPRLAGAEPLDEVAHRYAVAGADDAARRAAVLSALEACVAPDVVESGAAAGPAVVDLGDDADDAAVLAAVAEALGERQDLTGAIQAAVAVSGRDARASRTVGPLAHRVRIAVPLGSVDSATEHVAAELEAATSDPGRWTRLVSGDPATAPRFGALPPATIVLGDAVPAPTGDAAPVVRVLGRDDDHGPRLESAHLDAEELERVARRARDLLASARRRASRPRTADGRPMLANVTDSDLAALAGDPPAAVLDVWPLTPLQEGLYFQSRIDGTDGDVYTAQFHLDLDRRVDVPALSRALADLLARHAALRVAVRDLPDGGAVQVVTDVAEVPVTVVGDLDEEAVEAWMADDRTRPFDLARAPLWRAAVLRRPGGDRIVVNREFLLWDGWSAGPFVDELLDAYARERGDLDAVRGDEVTVGPSFREYLARIAGRDREASVRAWARELDGLRGPTLVAPGAGAAPARTPDREVTELDEATSAGLRATARRTGVTLNTVVHTALTLALSARLGETDVVVGTTAAGRAVDLPDVDRGIGMYLNTVPVRTALEPGETIADLLRRVQDEAADRMGHDHVGLGDIQAAAGLGQLFDVLFVLQNFKDPARMAEQFRRHGLTGEGSVDHTHYPLTVVVSPDERLRVTVDHRPDLLDPRRAEVVSRTLFDTLAEFARADVDTASVLELTTGLGERGRFGTGTGGAHPTEVHREMPARTVAELLAETAGRVPDRVALVDDRSHWTFAELQANVGRIAARLRDAGAGPETRVAVAVPRSNETVAAFFAVLAAGAAYVPLELDHPDERLRTVIDAAAPVAVLTTGRVAGRLEGSAPAAVRIDVDEVLDSETPGDARALSVDDDPHLLDRPAYVVFTSGSTGAPKGVVVGHRGLTTMLVNHRERIFDPVVRAAGDRVLTVAHTVSFAFDMSWEELLWLIEGHEVHVCDEELRRDADALVELCRDRNVDVINVTPTYASALLDAGLMDGGHRPALVLLGGEAVPDVLWRTLAETPGVLGYNLYGPTEYTINTLGAGTDDSATPTVGTAILNTRTPVLDRWLRPVDDGVAGELYATGDGLARGYLDRPDLTAASFVADPTGIGRRLYRTGDLVRRRPDGLLDYLGRGDDQVKVRGHRVEPAESAAALASCPGVRQAAVVAVADPATPGSSRLVGYVVAEPDVDGDALPAAALGDLRGRIPDPLVPATVVVLDSLPMTVNGKLDRAALPVPELGAGGGRAPRTEAERLVVDLVSEVLGVDDVGADADFFDVGGHSIAAMRLVGRLRAVTGVDVRIRDVFDRRTVDALAELIGSAAAAGTGDGAGGAGAEAGRPAAPAGPERVADLPDVVPLTAGQQRLWLTEEIGGAGLAYRYAIVLEVDQALVPAALRRALADVLARHDALRGVVLPDASDPAGARRRVLDPAEAAAALDVREAVVDGHGRGAADDGIAATVRDFLTEPVDVTSEVPVAALAVRDPSGGGVLALRLHHMAVDEGSEAPLLRDLDLAYRAALAGRTPDLGEAPLGMADLAVWEQRVADEHPEALDDDLAYWRRELSGAPVVLDLPYDRPHRAPSPDRAPARAVLSSVRLDAGRARALRELAARHGASSFMLVHALAAAWIARLTAADDVVLGTPVSARRHEGLADSVGFYVDTVPLRTDVSDDPDLPTLLERVRGHDLEAFDRTLPSFQRIVAELAPERVPGLPPLVQVLVAHRPLAPETLELFGTTARPVAVRPEQPQFDLSLLVGDLPGDDGAPAGLELTLVHSDALFDPDTARWMLEGLLATAAHAAEHPEHPLAASRWGALPEGSERGPEPAAVPPVTTALRRAPRAEVALIDPAASLRIDGAGLRRRVDELAAALRSRGVRPGDVVALDLPRGAAFVVACHAALEVGAPWLPMDPAAGAERRAWIRETARPVLAVRAAGAESRGDEEPDGLEVLAVGPDGAVVGGVEPSLDSAAASDSGSATGDAEGEAGFVPCGFDPAYVLFTSGSTGRPKGVVNVHEALANRLAWHEELLGPAADEVVLHKTPTTFDVSVWELLWPHLHGGRVVIAPPGAESDPGVLARLMVDEGVTLVHFVPSMLSEFLAHPGAREVTSLRTIVCSGEALGGDLARRVRAMFPGVRLVNLYGPTEAAVDVTAHECTDADRGPAVPIGGPVAGCGTLVLDHRLRRVPVGVPGELYLEGVQLASGYFRAPALTADRFVAHPDGGGRRLYRTGDLVRREPGGELVYLGRRDGQIKLGGVRIELAEVDAALAAAEGVAAAAADVRRGPGGDVLVGYVVPASGDSTEGRTGAPNASAIRAAVARRLPGAAVPSVIVVIDALTHGATGKLDRSALPDPERTVTGGEAPREGLEATIAAAVGAALGVEVDDREADLLGLGAHSLTLVRVATAIEEATGVRPRLAEMFDAPTVAGIAAAVDGAGRTDPGAPTAARRDPDALSPGERQMWILDSLAGSGGAYDIPFGWRVSGGVDREALAAALGDVTDRHEALRTVYPLSGGAPRREVLDPGPGSRPRLEVSGPAADTTELLGRVRARGLDLTSAPPVRAAVAPTAGGDDLVVVLVHHIALDEASSHVLATDLAVAYDARRGGREPRWEAPATGYREIAPVAPAGDPADPGTPMGAALDRWRRRLADAPAESGPVPDRPRPAVADLRGAEVGLDLSADVADGLRRLASAHGMSPFMVVHAIVVAVLRRHGGGADVVMGTPVRSASAAAYPDVVGYFLNTVPLRTRLAGGADVGTLLDEVRRADLDALDDADVPFEDVVRAVGRPGSASAHPVFQTMVVLVPVEPGAQPVLGEGTEAAPTRTETAKFDLSFDLVDPGRGHGMVGRIEFATSLFDRGSVEAFAATFAAVAGALTGATDATPVESLWSGDGARLSELPAAPAEPGTVDRLVARRLEGSREDPALIHDGGALSRGELADRIRALAARLRAEGAGPEVVVAVDLPRGPEALTSVFAVLLAGGTLLVLDRQSPAERRHELLDASGARVVIGDDGSAYPDGAIRVEATAGWPVAPPPVAPHPDLTPESAAYVVYTSGTTGRPKGVVVTHGALHALVEAHDRALGEPARRASGRDVVTVGHTWPLHFDAAWQPQCWFLSGGVLDLVGEEVRRDPARLLERLRRNRWEFTEVLPSMLGHLLDLGLAGERGSEHRPAAIACGGEAVPERVWNALAADPWMRAYNLYGPSEATVDTLWAEFDDRTGPVIGRPVAGDGAVVLDDRLEPVPAGVVGELYVRGAGLARGYLGAPGVTASSFVADPAGGGGRVYRTGDLVRMRTDGLIEYRGRADDQLKIRGHRVEPAEVEAVAEAVVGATAIARAVRRGAGMRLAVYIEEPVLAALGDGDVARGAERVRAGMSRRVPPAMVPASVEAVPAWPLLSSGKVDRSALPDPRPVLPHGRPPADEVERAVCVEIARALGTGDPAGGEGGPEGAVAPVDPDADLVDLGLDSLGAAVVAMGLDRRGMPVRVGDVLSAGSGAALAARIRDASGTGAPVAEPADPSGGAGGDNADRTG